MRQKLLITLDKIRKGRLVRQLAQVKELRRGKQAKWEGKESWENL